MGKNFKPPEDSKEVIQEEDTQQENLEEEALEDATPAEDTAEESIPDSDPPIQENPDAPPEEEAFDEENLFSEVVEEEERKAKIVEKEIEMNEKKKISPWMWVAIALAFVVVWGVAIRYAQGAYKEIMNSGNAPESVAAAAPAAVDPVDAAIVALEEQILMLQQEVAVLTGQPMPMQPALAPAPEEGPAMIDIDPDTVNFKDAKDGNMSYKCLENDIGVVLSMDPGIFMGYPTNELGAAMGAECTEGEVISFSTPHWSKAALHWRVHGIVMRNVTVQDVKAYTAQLAVEDGKELSVFFPLEGNPQVLVPNQ